MVHARTMHEWRTAKAWWPLLLRRFSAVWAQALAASLSPIIFLLSAFPPVTMAEQEAPRRGVRRAAAKADRAAEERRVRQRLEDIETRVDRNEMVGRSHEQRIAFQESPQRIVLRGFSCVPEFFRTRGGDFKLAKRAFIGVFFSRTP